MPVPHVFITAWNLLQAANTAKTVADAAIAGARTVKNISDDIGERQKEKETKKKKK